MNGYYLCLASSGNASQVIKDGQVMIAITLTYDSQKKKCG